MRKNTSENNNNSIAPILCVCVFFSSTSNILFHMVDINQPSIHWQIQCANKRHNMHTIYTYFRCRLLNALCTPNTQNSIYYSQTSTLSHIHGGCVCMLIFCVSISSASLCSLFSLPLIRTICIHF